MWKRMVKLGGRLRARDREQKRMKVMKVMKQVDFASFWVNIKFVFNKVWHAYLTHCNCWDYFDFFFVSFSSAPVPLPLFSSESYWLYRWKSLCCRGHMYNWCSQQAQHTQTSNMYKQTSTNCEAPPYGNPNEIDNNDKITIQDWVEAKSG